MQLYDGLPIITNKITTEEQKGIPHHLLGQISLKEDSWHVDNFKREATKVADEIRSRGNLPIVVGGTNYYVDTLLFEDITLEEVQNEEGKQFPLLDEPTEVLLEELRKVDPVMAGRWHPKDRRKIQRSLEIYLTSGKPASEFYAEQRARKIAKAREAAEAHPWEKLMFWVYAERDTLTDRLDARVDKMVEGGLMDEVRELYAFKRGRETAKETVDMTRGIWQSIGYRQMEPHLEAVDAGAPIKELETTKAQGLAEMKTATRRYAKYQTRWIRLQQFPRLKDEVPAAVDALYLLDSTDVSAYRDNVVLPAAEITEKFLAGEARPLPQDISQLARDVLEPAKAQPEKAQPNERKCDTCNVTIMYDHAWEKHMKSKSHRAALNRRKRLSLVPVDVPTDARDNEEKKRREKEVAQRPVSPEVVSTLFGED